MRSRPFVRISIIFVLLLGGLFTSLGKAQAGTTGTKVYLPVIQTISNNTSFPSLDQFIESVDNGQAGVVRGVYVPGDFALQVVQQPEGNYSYISSKPDAVTQYDLAEQLGVIGFLAHNNLAGAKFFLLGEGENVSIVYGDGYTMGVQVVELDRYQALDPRDSHSWLLNLDTGELISSNEAFLKYYDQPGMIVFQTCISKDGISSWGRLFVVAKPIS